ncbi:unnamed protein product [Rhizoctonia solani]|uniref:F-box domain-containing protein n=1 Tax=Rhizoctonia solani TaxID=456999 RepID=A0A8H3H436_9AGAM|nr:unnamed protein product [Rhizoctonia solani]
MQLNDLPPEIIQQIFRQIPPTRDSLSTTSPVCKTWREIILPLLFSSVRLFKQDQNSFIKRIIDETNDATPYSTESKLSSYVRRLVVCRPMDEQEIGELGLAIQIMGNLEHITWDTVPLSSMGWNNTIGLLQQRSPQLRSLQLILTQDASAIKLAGGVGPKLLLHQAEGRETDEHNDSEQVIAFHNLRKLSIKFDESSHGGMSEEFPPEILYLIRGARSIESLHLDFERIEESHYQAIDEIFTSLSSDYFPDLSSIQIVSSRLLHIDHFGGPEVRRFIARHNQLKRVIITSTRCPDPNPPETITARDVEIIMPSVRYFGGTPSGVGVFLQSSLAGQLEGLELSVHFKEILQTRVPELSRLKKLLIRSYYCQNRGNRAWTTILRVLDQLASKTLCLRELTIRVDSLWRGKYDSHNLPKLPHGLTQLPNLRRLTIVHREGSLRNQDIRGHIVREFPRLELVINWEVGSKK